MSWQREMVIMLRYLINDIDPTSFNNTDARLESLLAVSAQLVQSEMELINSYTINIENASISPDPTTPNKDLQFINLVVLKAACLSDQGSFRAKAMMDGIRANAGPASLSVSGGAASLLPLLQMGSCKAYDELKFSGTQADFIRAVLSPFTSDDFDPQFDLRQDYGGNWFDDPGRSER